MSVLIADPAAGVWIQSASGAEEKLEGDLAWPCAPCACAGCAAVCCLDTRQCLCYEKKSRRLLCRMPAVPGVCAAALSPCGRFLYQLSSEADCIHTRCAATGELLYAAAAGVFPRMMKLDHKGAYLLTAGGAVNEAYLFTAPDLRQEAVISARHPCFGADFWAEGMVLVCAEGGEDIRTEVCTLREGRVRPRKLAELPGEPCGLCVCPDGRHMLLSTRAGLMKMNLATGAPVWNCPEWAYAMRVECRGEWALVSGCTDGGVWLFSHHRPWERRLVYAGSAAQACFV